MPRRARDNGDGVAALDCRTDGKMAFRLGRTRAAPT
ncbi:MAG: hypothetical protein A07HR67_00746, partial [uncultured archaeon A07HR67]